FAFHDSASLARIRFDPLLAHPAVPGFRLRLPEGSNLEFVRPTDSSIAPQRPLLVVDRRHGLAKSAPADFSLSAGHDRLRNRGFDPFRSELATRHALDAWHRAGA